MTSLYLETHIKAGNKILLKRIHRLFEELEAHPETGTGKSHKLKYKKSSTFYGDSSSVNSAHLQNPVFLSFKSQAVSDYTHAAKRHRRAGYHRI